MSRELPILCAGPVVRAILESRQTQDRRPVKPMRGHQSEWLTIDTLTRSPRARMAPLNKIDHGRDELGAQFAHPMADAAHPWSPLGWVAAPWSPGDVVYVRETWRSVGWRPENGHWIEYAADERKVWREAPHDTLSIDVYTPAHPDRWRPSIHMPKWAARIRLHVLSVGVERVNAISEEDARAEGCATISEFSALWDGLYGAGAFERGDWCWVTRFELVQ